MSEMKKTFWMLRMVDSDGEVYYLRRAIKLHGDEPIWLWAKSGGEQFSTLEEAKARLTKDSVRKTTTLPGRRVEIVKIGSPTPTAPRRSPKKLTETQRLKIAKMFISDHSIDEIAKKFGISTERVRTCYHQSRDLLLREAQQALIRRRESRIRRQSKDDARFFERAEGWEERLAYYRSLRPEVAAPDPSHSQSSEEEWPDGNPPVLRARPRFNPAGGGWIRRAPRHGGSQ